MILKTITVSFIRYFALSLVTLTITACVPFPHFQQESPALEGTIKQNGTFAENIEVILAVNQQISPGCQGGKQRTRTDANGKFRFEATKYFTPVFMFGDRGDSWELCFKLLDGTEASWSDGDWWGGSSLQRLECVINNKEKSVNRVRLRTLDDLLDAISESKDTSNEINKDKNFCRVEGIRTK